MLLISNENLHNLLHFDSFSVINQLDKNEQRQIIRDQAESAVRTLIQWAGDDPDREGLIETPKG